jgi:predicted amino acid dehydrogenase
MSKANRLRRVGEGQTAKWHFHVIDAFVTTGATKTVNVPLSRVEAVNLTAIGTPAGDEELSVNNTVTGTLGDDTAAIVGSNGNTGLVVTRTGASKTSGLKFSIEAIGQK